MCSYGCSVSKITAGKSNFKPPVAVASLHLTFCSLKNMGKFCLLTCWILFTLIQTRINYPLPWFYGHFSDTTCMLIVYLLDLPQMRLLLQRLKGFYSALWASTSLFLKLFFRQNSLWNQREFCLNKDFRIQASGYKCCDQSFKHDE